MSVLPTTTCMPTGTLLGTTNNCLSWALTLTNSIFSTWPVLPSLLVPFIFPSQHIHDCLQAFCLNLNSSQHKQPRIKDKDYIFKNHFQLFYFRCKFLMSREFPVWVLCSFVQKYSFQFIYACDRCSHTFPCKEYFVDSSSCLRAFSVNIALLTLKIFELLSSPVLITAPSQATAKENEAPD